MKRVLCIALFIIIPILIMYLLIEKNNGDRFYSLPVQSPGQLHERTERRWDNLLKSYAANERGG